MKWNTAKKILIKIGLLIVITIPLNPINIANPPQPLSLSAYIAARNHQFAQNSPTLNPAKILDLKKAYDQSSAKEWLKQPVEPNTFRSEDHKSQTYTTPANHNATLNKLRSRWLANPEYLLYKFMFRDITDGDKIISTAWNVHYVSDYLGRGTVTPKFNINKAIDPSHKYHITFEFYNGVNTKVKFSGTAKDNLYATAEEIVDGNFKLFSGANKELIDSASIKAVLPPEKNLKSINEISTNSYMLNYLQFSYKHYGNNPSWGNDTYGFIDIPRNKTTLYANITKRSYKTYFQQSKLTMSLVAPYLFTVLTNSTQQDNRAKGGEFWVDNTHPPVLHLGLNNNLFKALKNYKWRKSISGSEPNSKILDLINNDKHLINMDNYDSVAPKIREGALESELNLSTPAWAFWDSAKAPKILAVSNSNRVPKFSATSILKWLVQRHVSSSQENFSNEELLRQMLLNGEGLDSAGQKHRKAISIRYKLNKGEVDSSNNPVTTIKTKLVPTNELFDFWIPLENISTTLQKPSIQILGINLIWSNPIKGQKENLSILPAQENNFGQYFINYNARNYTYTAFYQPNPINISNGVWFYPTGDHAKYKYDRDLNKWALNKNHNWVKVPNSKVYSSFIYKTTVNGEQLEKAFIEPKAHSGDLQEWVTTDGGVTLKEWLKMKANGQAFKSENIYYVVDTELIMVVNPYTGTRKTSDGTTYLDGSSGWEIKRIIDNSNGKSIVMGDFTDPKLSNSFNKAFSISRTSHITTDGLLRNGEHSLSVQLSGGIKSDLNVKLIIDTEPPNPTYKNISQQNKPLFYKTETGDYKRLYTSTREVNALLTETGIRNGTISWVDSAGNWYSKSIDIKNSYVNGHVVQSAQIIIDYQGLFKINYTDLAGNSVENYLWIQKDNKTGSNIISYSRVADGAENDLVQTHTDGQSQFYWFNDMNSAKDKLIIPNMLTQNIKVRTLNKTTGKMEEWSGIPSWLTMKSQSVDSVGSTINSTSRAHSLAGDELLPLIDSSVHVTPASASSRKFYEAHIKIPPGVFADIEIESAIYTQQLDNSGNPTGKYKNVPTRVSVYNSNTYDIPELTNTGAHPNINVTNFSGGGTIDKGNVYNPSKAETSSISETGSKGWRKVSKGFNTNIFPEFVANGSLKVEWSQMWYNWYKPEDVTGTSAVTLKKEGKYKISYVDLNNNKHTINYLVFNYPRDFSKYVARKSTTADGKTIIKTQTFYNKQAIATIQDSSTYRINGEFILPTGALLGPWADQIVVKAIEHHYDSSINFKANTLDELKSILGKAATSSIVHINPNPIIKTETINGKERKVKIWQVIVKGWSDINLHVFKPIETKYSANGDITMKGTPNGVPKSLSVTVLEKSSQPITEAELNASGYWTGKYIDVYEESGHLPELLIDDDNDPNTPKVHQMEDYDHFMTFLAEWLANGGSKEDFFKNHANHKSGEGGEKKVGDQITKSHKQGSKKPTSNIKPIQLGLILGTFGGVVAVTTTSLTIYFKRTGKGFSKTKIAKNKNKKKGSK